MVLTKEKALEYDKEHRGRLLVEWDDETMNWGVFGSESGFCYETFETESLAEEFEEEKNKEWFQR